MGLYDRDYTQESYRPSYGRYQHIGMPKPTTMVARLMIINIAVFLICVLIRPVGVFVYNWFQLDPSSVGNALQIWRLVTYQFLHDPASIWHIFFNMFVLYMFGRILEPHLGPRRFLIFYLICGAVGGVFYLLLTAIGFLPAKPMVGASGSILGIIGACAVMFPQIKMIIFPIFIPISIRAAAISGAALYIFIILVRGHNAGGQAAHLAGMATGVMYALWPRISVRYNLKSRTSPWQKKIQNQQQLSAQVDKILEKVYKEGISSLSRKEKNILKKATQLHQEMKK